MPKLRTGKLFYFLETLYLSKVQKIRFAILTTQSRSIGAAFTIKKQNYDTDTKTQIGRYVH